MDYSKIKLCELIDKSESKELLLPNFQRDFVWDRSNQQIELLSSWIFNIPIGSLLILNGEKDYFAIRELCKNAIDEDSVKDPIMYLLDGQQRISTLKSVFFDFFSDIKNWKDIRNSLQDKLRTRWFINIEPVDEIDLFGYNNLKFNGANYINNYSPSDVKKFISYEVIYPNQKEKWFHPEFELEKWYKDGKVKENTKIRIHSEELAKNLKVPLYGIANNQANPSSTLQYKTLKKIAMNRIESIKADINDGIIQIEDIIGCDSEFEIDERLDELMSDWVNDVYTFLIRLKDRELPIIELSKDEMNRAIYTFENVNKGGVSLSTYDLVVAKAAHNRDLESLTVRIKHQIDNKMIIPNSVLKKNNHNDMEWNPLYMGLIKENELSNIIKDQYLNMLSIICNFNGDLSQENGDNNNIKLEWIKKYEQLNLTSDQINTNTNNVMLSILRACSFLQFRCGIVKISNLQYKLMLLPIAYILKDDENWTNEDVINRIEYWYWVSLFSGAYRKEQNSRAIDDIKLLYKFIKGDNSIFNDRNNKVLNLEEYSDLDTLTFKNKDVSVPSAIHNGILQYVLSKSPRDFIDDEIYLNTWDIASGKELKFNSINKKKKLAIEDHHICPLGSVTRIGESTRKLRNENKNHMLNSPLNRTYISSVANSLISDKDPVKYFHYVSKLTIYNHCIPVPIKDHYTQKSDETENEFFYRILKERFNELKRNLESELYDLL